LRGVINGENPVGILDDAVGWSLAVFILHQEAIGGQLQHVGWIGNGWGSRGFDFRGDDASSLLDQIIGFAGEEVARGKERCLAAIPGTGVGVDHPAGREACSLPPCPRPSQQDKCDSGEKDDEETEKRNHEPTSPKRVGGRMRIDSHEGLCDAQYEGYPRQGSHGQ